MVNEQNVQRVKARFFNVLDQYFKKNPEQLASKYSDIANACGIDYRQVKKFLETEDLTEYTKLREQKLTNSELTSKSKTSDYGTKVNPDKTYPTLEEYCELYNIPYDKVTSVKFVNHNGQAAWNAVCDLTKISEVHLDNYFDQLKDALTTILEPVRFETKETSSEKAYHFYHSDKHTGAKIRDYSLYANDWNSTEFEKRMMLSIEDYVESFNDFGRFDKVLVADLGDSVDGWNGKTTRNSNHSLPQNMDNKETFDTYVKVMCRFFDTIVELDLANEYEFFVTSNDNHGGDFSYIVNRAVEVYLNVKYPQIKTSVNCKFIETYEYGDHVFMMSHGKDDQDMKFGLPLNLDLKTEEFINRFVDDRKINDKFLHFIKGDLHQESTNYGRKFRYRNVLSLFGSSSWSMTNFGPSRSGVSSEIVYKHKNKVLTNTTIF